MLARKIHDNIYWVGVIDWKLRNFHGYTTHRGTTYNAYLIIDEKITLIDNVKAGFTDEMIARISSIIDPKDIEVIVSNHGEPDHSGSLPKLLELAPNAKVYSAYPNGVKILKAQYGDLPIEPAKNNDSIKIGKRTLQFFHAPMVHWPDNMVTYVPEDKILFSNDIFGQHYATSKVFDYENDLAVVLMEARKYYANIVLPYTKQAHKIAELVSDLDVEMIATSHGIVWKEHIKDIFELYQEMVSITKRDKAVVVYDSMWGSTARIAKEITEAFRENNVSVILYNINDTHASDIITEIMDSKYLAIGSPTFNNNILPTIASLLCYINGLAPANLKYIAFGSYGWGGQSVGIISDALNKYEPLIDPVKLLYVPKDEDIQHLKDEIKKALSKD